MTATAFADSAALSTGLPLDEIETGLFEIVRKFLKTPDARFTAQTTMEEAQIDSLDLVELVFEIEERFGVEINFNANERPVAELTFGDVVALIRSGLMAKAKTA